ncbi:MAG: DNA-directed RNA polymerase subunit delta [Selenomonadaceae bacterium]
MDFLNSSEVDVAYYVLSQKGETMYYKDLVMEVIDKTHKPVQSLSGAIAEVYTLLNVDSRFQHAGNSMWGLTEWNPPEVKRTHTTSTTTTKTTGTKTKTTSRRREKLLEGIQEEE